MTDREKNMIRYYQQKDPKKADLLVKLIDKFDMELVDVKKIK